MFEYRYRYITVLDFRLQYGAQFLWLRAPQVSLRQHFFAHYGPSKWRLGTWYSTWWTDAIWQDSQPCIEPPVERMRLQQWTVSEVLLLQENKGSISIRQGIHRLQDQDQVKWVEHWLNVAAESNFVWQSILSGAKIKEWHWTSLNGTSRANGHQGPLVVAMMPSTRSLASEALCGDPIVWTHPKSLFLYRPRKKCYQLPILGCYQPKGLQVTHPSPHPFEVLAQDAWKFLRDRSS